MPQVVRLLLLVAVAAAGVLAVAAFRPQSKSLPAAPQFNLALDPSLSFEQRIQHLLEQMTPAEKIAQLQTVTPAIPRLGVAAFDHWSEALHGVTSMRGFEKGYSTVFPQCIGQAATWNPQLVRDIAEAVSIEGRIKSGGRGALFFCPVLNILRDPRWGRGQETFGEDPHLTGTLAVSYINGFQGNHPKYLLNAATVKHFAAHSGPEPEKGDFNAKVSADDLCATYLPAFHKAIRHARPAAVMTAYNAINGVPCTASDALLNELLRGRWGFDGLVVSDAVAGKAVFSSHQYIKESTDAAAAVLKAGCDVQIDAASDLQGAWERGLVSMAELDRGGAHAHGAVSPGAL